MNSRFYQIAFYDQYDLLHDTESRLKKAKKIWNDQSDFINWHFIKWVPAFCDKIGAGSNNTYYLLLAECLKKFVLYDHIPAFPEKNNKR